MGHRPCSQLRSMWLLSKYWLIVILLLCPWDSYDLRQGDVDLTCNNYVASHVEHNDDVMDFPVSRPNETILTERRFHRLLSYIGLYSLHSTGAASLSVWLWLKLRLQMHLDYFCCAQPEWLVGHSCHSSTRGQCYSKKTHSTCSLGATVNVSLCKRTIETAWLRSVDWHMV